MRRMLPNGDGSPHSTQADPTDSSAVTCASRSFFSTRAWTPNCFGSNGVLAASRS